MKTCIFDNPITGRRTQYLNGEEGMSIDESLIITNRDALAEFKPVWRKEWETGRVIGDLSALPKDLQNITLKYSKKPETEILGMKVVIDGELPPNTIVIRRDLEQKPSEVVVDMGCNPPTDKERAANLKAIHKLPKANRFRLMFGQPPLKEETRGWQPIETAPKDQDILVWNEVVGSYRSRATTMDGSDLPQWPMTFWERPGMWYPKPTHWMPLPPPPTA